MAAPHPASSAAAPARSGDDVRQQEAGAFLESARELRERTPLWFVRHPVATARGFRGLHALPMLTATTSRSVEAGAVRCGLDRRPRVRRWMIGGVTAVLTLPSVAEDYLQGSEKQTLRRKIRAAERQGVTWRPVDDPKERQLLLHLLNDSERNHSLAVYRFANPRNADTLGVHLWLAAFGPDDEPLLLSVTPIDGEWATLRTFRVLHESDRASAARYLMSWVLVQHLVERGVRHLADTQSPASLSPGLRFFQRLLGYRLVRVRLARRR